jgi:hypothetical protein
MIVYWIGDRAETSLVLMKTVMSGPQRSLQWTLLIADWIMVPK